MNPLYPARAAVTPKDSLAALVVSSALALALGCHDAPPVESAPGSTGCPPSWLQPPSVAPGIAPPAGNASIVLHAAAGGTQNYACGPAAAADAGSAPPSGDAPSYAWKFAGPEATLDDCHGAPIGRHFASDAGASAPEWQTSDGASIVAHKVAASSPDGGAPAVPWLLLATDHAAGTGPLAAVTYIQRVGTSGGVAPGVPCDASNAGVTRKVPYTADYYFYAPSAAP